MHFAKDHSNIKIGGQTPPPLSHPNQGAAFAGNTSELDKIANRVGLYNEGLTRVEARLATLADRLFGLTAQAVADTDQANPLPAGALGHLHTRLDRTLDLVKALELLADRLENVA